MEGTISCLSRMWLARDRSISIRLSTAESATARSSIRLSTAFTRRGDTGSSPAEPTMVAKAQLAERRVVVPEAAGSSPASHPMAGCASGQNERSVTPSPSGFPGSNPGPATTLPWSRGMDGGFRSRQRRFESCWKHERVAQWKSASPKETVGRSNRPAPARAPMTEWLGRGLRTSYGDSSPPGASRCSRCGSHPSCAGCGIC